MNDEQKTKLTETGVFDYERAIELRQQSQKMFSDLANFLSKVNDIDDEEIQKLNGQLIETIKTFDDYQEIFRKVVKKMRDKLLEIL